ncbi:MAG TPA: hypothetical protein PKW95_23450 [bacterium]|nr:hypothetical protein [bacterium]
MNKFRLLVLLLMAAILFSSLLACSSDDDDDDDNDAADDDDDDDDDDDTGDDDTTDDDDTGDDDDDTYAFGDVTGYVEIDYAEDLACKEGYCFVAAKSKGVYVVDVSNLGAPSIVGQYDPSSGESYNLVLDGDNLYVANRDNMLKIDVSDPANPDLVWEFIPTTIGILNAIARGDDGTLYVGGSFGSNGYLEVVSEAKGDPVSLGEVQVATGETCYNLGVGGDVAYCGGGEGTLISVDVSDPADMSVLNEYYNAGTAGFEPWGQDVKLDGDTLFFSDWGAGLIAVDVSNPAAMAELSVLQTSDGFYGSYKAGALTIGGTAYTDVWAAANSWGGLVLVDAADPADLQQIGDALDIQVDMSDAPHGVWVMGKYAYVADNGEQMLIIVKIAD